MTDHTPLTRSEIQKLANQIKSGWLPPDEAIEEAFNGLRAVLRDPLRNPRATVRAARLIFEVELALGVRGNNQADEHAQDSPHGDNTTAHEGIVTDSPTIQPAQF